MLGSLLAFSSLKCNDTEQLRQQTAPASATSSTTREINSGQIVFE